MREAGGGRARRVTCFFFGDGRTPAFVLPDTPALSLAQVRKGQGGGGRPHRALSQVPPALWLQGVVGSTGGRVLRDAQELRDAVRGADDLEARVAAGAGGVHDEGDEQLLVWMGMMH